MTYEEIIDVIADINNLTSLQAARFIQELCGNHHPTKCKFLYNAEQDGLTIIPNDCPISISLEIESDN